MLWSVLLLYFFNLDFLIFFSCLVKGRNPKYYALLIPISLNTLRVQTAMIFWVFVDGINPLSCKRWVCYELFSPLLKPVAMRFLYLWVQLLWDTNRAVWSSSRCSYWHTHREWLSLHCILWINIVTGRQKWNKSFCITIDGLWAF